MKDDRAHIALINRLEAHVVDCQLPLFLLDCQGDLFREIGHAHLDVSDEMSVERLGQEWDSHFG